MVVEGFNNTGLTINAQMSMIIVVQSSLVGSDGGRAGIGVVVGLVGRGFRRVKTPPGPEGLLNLLRSGELQVADLLGDDGALVLGLQAGDQLSLEAAGLLGVQVTHLLRDIDERGDGLVVTLLGTLLSRAAGTTDLNGQFLTAGVTNKLARLLLNVTGGTRRLVHGLADILTLSITDFDEGPVTLLHSLLHSLLFKSNLTALLKIFLAHLLLGRVELSDVGVVTLLHILVGALEDGVLLESGDCLVLLNAAESGVWVGLAATEVDAGSLDVLLPGLPPPLDDVCGRQGQEAEEDEELQEDRRTVINTSEEQHS